jgi:hypothetical protein
MMTSDAELPGPVAVFELVALNMGRRFAELADRASADLAQLGDPHNKDEAGAELIGAIAFLGAGATYELARYPETLAFAETQVSAGRAIPHASVTLARGLNWRAMAKEALGQLASAAEDYQEGIAVAERIDPPDTEVRDDLFRNYMDLRAKRGEQDATRAHGTALHKSLFNEAYSDHPVEVQANHR